MNFRYKYIEGIGYFAQVKHSIFSRWKTIEKHSSGFGLYSENHAEHPLKDNIEATARCKLYEQWAYNKRTRSAVYVYV